jgi:hypothetical protein
MQRRRVLKDTIWRCGHASHLMDAVQSVETHPQIHLHFLTPEEEPDARLELCCHGCGASLTVRYRADTRSYARSRKVRKTFLTKHAGCPDRGYRDYCPDWRTSFELLDIRPKLKRAFEHTKQDIPLLGPPPAGQSRHAGRTEEGPGR